MVGVISVPRVKICGVTSCRDASHAVSLGADAVGVLVGRVHPSEDFVTPSEARAIFGVIPPFASAVLVSHLVDVEDLIDLIDQTSPHAVQIHSPMDPQDVLRLRRERPTLRILKSIHILDENSLNSAEIYTGLVDAFVADSINPATGQVGGTGITHDWGLTARLVRSVTLPVVLAGGLTPLNVREAIDTVRPYAVDVNSGVKAADGSKDPGRMRAFIEEARRPVGAEEKCDGLTLRLDHRRHA